MYLKYSVIAAYALAMLMCGSCSHSHSESEHEGHNHNHALEEHEHAHEEAHHHEDGEEHDHDHEGEEAHDHEHNHAAGDIIVFSEHKAEKFGVKSAPATVSDGVGVVKVTGEVLPAQGEDFVVVAPVSGIVRIPSGIFQGASVNAGAAICSVSAGGMVGGDSNAQARIAYESAKRELDRIKPLYEDKIVTRKEYNAALENFETAKNAYVPVSGSAVVASSKISGVISSLDVANGQYVDAGAPIATVNRNSKLRLCAYLPERYAAMAPQLSGANIRMASGKVYELASLGGKRVSAPAQNVVKSGYVPVSFEFEGNGDIPSGSFVEVFLLGGAAGDAVAVPTQAILEELGNYYVFVQLDEDCYEKRAVSIGKGNGVTTEILSGVKPGENIVAEGVMYIRLAANSSEIPSGCQHSHH